MLWLISSRRQLPSHLATIQAAAESFMTPISKATSRQATALSHLPRQPLEFRQPTKSPCRLLCSASNNQSGFQSILHSNSAKRGLSHGDKVLVRDCKTVEETIQYAFEELQSGIFHPINIRSFWTHLSKLLLDKKIQNVRSNYHPDLAPQLSAIFDHTRNEVKYFEQRDLVQTVFALSKILKSLSINGHKGKNSKNLKVIHDVLLENAPDSKDGIFLQIAEASSPMLTDFTEQHLSNLAYAYANIGFAPNLNDGKTLFPQIAAAAIPKLQSFKTQELSNIVWAFATVGFSHPPLFQKVADIIVAWQDMREFRPQAFSNILWAYSSINERNSPLFQKIGKEIILFRDLITFSPQDLCTIVCAFASVGESNPSLFGKVGQAILSSNNFNSFKPQTFANIVWAYATANEVDPQLFQKLGDFTASLMKRVSFHPCELSMIAWAYAMMRQSHPELFHQISNATIERVSQFQPRELSNVLGAFSIIGWEDKSLYSTLAPAIQEALSECNGRDLANIAWAYTVADVNADCLFHENNGFIDCLTRKENELNDEELRQLHQWQLWQKELSTNITLPPNLQAKCDEVFRSADFQQSALQKDVISELRAIGYKLQVEAVLHSGYRVDALVKVGDEKVAIEVDGPWHFIGNMPLGNTALKKRQISNVDGVRIISVPYWKWNAVEWNQSERQKYLHSLLSKES